MTLPLRPSSTAPKTPGTAPTPPPAPTDPSPASVDRTASANRLRDYLEANPTRVAFGWKNNPSAEVYAFQVAMDFDQDDRDGILGPQVRRAGKTVGVSFPPRPS